MTEPFLGEIRLFAGLFAPVGWLMCDGSLQSIPGNEALFSLIGTTYGGDGVSTFALPDMRGRVPVHEGNGYGLGTSSGLEQVTLAAVNVPSHSHGLLALTPPGTLGSPKGNGTAAGVAGGAQIYVEEQASLAMSSAAVGLTGESKPHDNVQPFLALNYIIATAGIWPSQG